MQGCCAVWMGVGENGEGIPGVGGNNAVFGRFVTADVETPPGEEAPPFETLIDPMENTAAAWFSGVIDGAGQGSKANGPPSAEGTNALQLNYGPGAPSGGNDEHHLEPGRLAARSVGRDVPPRGGGHDDRRRADRRDPLRQRGRRVAVGDAPGPERRLRAGRLRPDELDPGRAVGGQPGRRHADPVQRADDPAEQHATPRFRPLGHGDADLHRRLRGHGQLARRGGDRGRRRQRVHLPGDAVLRRRRADGQADLRRRARRARGDPLQPALADRDAGLRGLRDPLDLRVQRGQRVGGR